MFSMLFKKIMKQLLLILTLLFLAAFKSDPLPNVLIIGDSISIGYTPFVQKALGGKATVVHNPGNARHTGNGLEKLNDWLGNKKWDVIHFNWGLHDLCYRSEQSKVSGNRDKENGKQDITLEEYCRNLEELVVRLKKTDATLIFATTTHVPNGEPGRFVNDDKRYNKVARKIMKKYNIEVNDLNKFSKEIHLDHRTQEGNVHYTSEGYNILSKPVIEIILKNL